MGSFVDGREEKIKESALEEGAFIPFLFCICELGGGWDCQSGPIFYSRLDFEYPHAILSVFLSFLTNFSHVPSLNNLVKSCHSI